ncbi:MAG: hypothetical protein FJ387_18850 [Verrucomicrobia bacterium]|nr:hypothetical protein [Verrucomicrobiota bacterium]
MQTPSESALPQPPASRSVEWSTPSTRASRSVFPNYSSSRTPAHAPSSANLNPPPTPSTPSVALARAFLYRFLAQAFAHPTRAAWDWLACTDTRQALRAAVQDLDLASTAPPALRAVAERLLGQLTGEGFASFHTAYLAAFGHAARGRCPLNEIEYGDLKADGLFQPHRLADLAAFYRAFGLEVAGDAGERHDHLGLELEFMCVLAAQEAYALEHRLGTEALTVNADAQRAFLRDHLGRWTPAFTRRLADTVNASALSPLAHFTRLFLESECARCGVPPGSSDLLLRPVDESAESLCAACGVPAAPPSDPLEPVLGTLAGSLPESCPSLHQRDP